MNVVSRRAMAKTEGWMDRVWSRDGAGARDADAEQRWTGAVSALCHVLAGG